MLRRFRQKHWLGKWFLQCKHVWLCLFIRLSKMWQRLARWCPRVCSGTSSKSSDLLLYPLTIGGHFIQSILHTDTHILNGIQLIHETLSLWVLKEWEGERDRLGKCISTQLKGASKAWWALSLFPSSPCCNKHVWN